MLEQLAMQPRMISSGPPQLRRCSGLICVIMNHCYDNEKFSARLKKTSKIVIWTDTHIWHRSNQLDRDSELNTDTSHIQSAQSKLHFRDILHLHTCAHVNCVCKT